MQRVVFTVRVRNKRTNITTRPPTEERTSRAALIG